MPPPQLLPKPKRHSRPQLPLPFIKIADAPETIVNITRISWIQRFKTETILIIEGDRWAVDPETGDLIVAAIEQL